MIGVDANILVYAHRRDSPWHGRARACLQALAGDRAAWAIPWPCLHEFLSIVTHPRIYEPPSTVTQAADQVDAWMASPTLVLLGEPHDHWPTLRRLVETGQVQGPLVHDARVAAICIGQRGSRAAHRRPRLQSVPVAPLAQSSARLTEAGALSRAGEVRYRRRRGWFRGVPAGALYPCGEVAERLKAAVC